MDLYLLNMVEIKQQIGLLACLDSPKAFLFYKWIHVITAL